MSIQTNSVLQNNNTTAILSNKEACELLIAQAIAQNKFIADYFNYTQKMQLQSGINAQAWADLLVMRDDLYRDFGAQLEHNRKTFSGLMGCEFSKDDFLDLAQECLTKHETDKP